MNQENCIFCKIVAGEVPSFKIAESEKFLAILDIAQYVDGHTIVIPKEHHEFVWDVPNVGEYFEFVQKVGNHYRDIGFKYVDTMTFGRMVPHAHVHLIPHNDDDPRWKEALAKMGEMQVDESRKLTNEKGNELQKRFAM